MDLVTKTDSDLEYLREEFQQMGLPTDEIEQEIANRKSKRLIRGAQPVIAQAGIDTVRSRAAKEGSLAQQAAEKAKGLQTTQSPDFLNRGMAVKEKDASAALLRAGAYDKNADRLKAKDEQWVKFKKSDDEFRNQKQADLMKAKTAAERMRARLAIYRELSTNIRDSKDALDEIKPGGIAYQRTLDALTKETDDAKKEDIRLEIERMKSDAHKLATEIRKKERTAAETEQELMADGVTPTTQPASQPAPGTQPAPVTPQDLNGVGYPSTPSGQPLATQAEADPWEWLFRGETSGELSLGTRALSTAAIAEAKRRGYIEQNGKLIKPSTLPTSQPGTGVAAPIALKPAQRTAISELKRRAQSPDPRIREAAIDALNKLQERGVDLSSIP